MFILKALEEPRDFLVKDRYEKMLKNIKVNMVLWHLGE